MAKRYGMDTPAVRKRRENVARQKAAEYQSRLMPDPGTPAWSQGLETSTPFFDIATVGMGGGLNLLRKGIARKLAQARSRRAGTRLREERGLNEPGYDPRADEYLDYGDDVVRRRVPDDIDDYDAWAMRMEPPQSYFDDMRAWNRKLAEARLRRQPAYSTPNVVGQQFRKSVAEARKQGKINRAIANRRRRMQGSMWDDL